MERPRQWVSRVVGTLGNLNKGLSVLQRQEERAGTEALGPQANQGKLREEKERGLHSPVSPGTLGKSVNHQEARQQFPRLQQMEETS